MDSGTLLNQLTNYDTTRKNSVDVLNEAMGKYGVPEIRNRVAGLRTTLTNTESALNNVDPSVTGRTQGSLVTEAQRQKQVTNERAPIMQQYGEVSSALGNESANLTDNQNLAKDFASGSIDDWNAGRAALQDRYSTTYQREQDTKANDLEQAKLRAAAAASSGFSFPTSTSPTPLGTSGTTDPVKARIEAIQQDAINDVAGRKGQSRAALLSDYNATLLSAQRGNQRDIAKVDAYKRLYPEIFQPAGPAVLSPEFGSQIKNKAASLLSSAGGRLKSNLGIFGF